MVEIENDLGRMRHRLWETPGHKAHECYLFLLHYSASAVDPLSFASFCAGPPQRFPIFVDRWWVPNPLWIGRLLTICFSSKGEGTGLVCSRMAAHGLLSLSVMGRSQDNAQPSRAAPWGRPARCAGWMKLALVHFWKVSGQIFLGLLLRSRQKPNEKESKWRNKPTENKDETYHSPWAS